MGEQEQNWVITDRGARPGNTNAMTHGGEAALNAIRSGQPLTGPAREAELAAIDEFNTAGRQSLVLRNAIRLQAVTDLFWAAVNGAAERGDLQALDRYVARFGWLAGATLRAWAQVKEEQKDAGNALDYEQILAQQGQEEHR